MHLQERRCQWPAPWSSIWSCLTGMGLCCFDLSKSSLEKKNKQKQSSGTAASPGAPKDVRCFSYDEMSSATRNFHPMNEIGRGGFGIVYRGTLRDGTFVAIKTLSVESNQGTNEFLTEIDTVSRIEHPALVRLIGCCAEGGNRMLVYEYVENNSLAGALFGPPAKRIPLDWRKRAAICRGTARGLAFLHEEAQPHIVHRDIKASNVLLDKDLLPKIGDFGLAKLFPDSVTHISTRVAGTLGYLAPEYALLGQLTKKADVYSYGVLVLETISGTSSSRSMWEHDMELLVERVWKLRDEGRLLDIVDPELKMYPEEEVLRFIKVALLCTQAAPQRRPGMGQVVELLSSKTNFSVKHLARPGSIKRRGRAGSRDERGAQSENASTVNTSSGDIDCFPRSMKGMQPR